MVCIEALLAGLGAGISDWPLPGTRAIPAETGQAAVARQAARNRATTECFMAFLLVQHGWISRYWIDPENGIRLTSYPTSKPFSYRNTIVVPRQVKRL
jgi:hypothetical protein